MEDRTKDVDTAGDHLSRAAKQAGQALRSQHRRSSAKAIMMTLDTSLQKFRSWRTEWVDSHDVQLELLWGEQGWANIRVLLTTIKEKSEKIESNELDGRKPRSSSHSRFKRALSNMPKKDIMSQGAERAYLLKSAMDLSGSIDQLWTHSEVTFDSLHGHDLFSRAISSPSMDKKKFLMNSILARSGSLALYRACANSGLDCNLEVNLLAHKPKSQASHASNEPLPLRTPSKLSYHIYTQTRDTQAETREIRLHHLTKAVTESEMSVEFDSEKVDLRSFESRLKSKFICIQPQREGAPSYFQISKPSTILKHGIRDKPLIEILKEDQSSELTKIPQSISFKHVELAFQLVMCGFYLLGTPWLAALSTKRVRRLDLGEHSHPFVIEIRTLDIEDLAFEDPEALAETRHLFRIGVLLMEIALSKSGHLDASLSKEPYIEIAKKLPLVEQSMGSEYCKATAFCLHDRRSVSQFGKPGKYRESAETAWTSYLMGLLGDYHSQVYQRFVSYNLRRETWCFWKLIDD